jgi:hypothetical protein
MEETGYKDNSRKTYTNARNNLIALDLARGQVHEGRGKGRSGGAGLARGEKFGMDYIKN